MEMTVENFNYSNVEECISDFSHVDKVRFGVYCAELVIDIYEKYNLSKAPRLAKENKKACKSFVIFAKDDARDAASASARAALAAADAARAARYDAANAAHAAANAARAAASTARAADHAAWAADAADAAAWAAGESIKENIVNWLNEFNSKNIETPEKKSVRIYRWKNNYRHREI
jgi:hypothetical protein